MRIKLTFERTAKVKEIGAISVEVGNSSTIADVYKRAHAGEFAEFLISDREYEDEEWEFSIMKQKVDNDDD